MLPSAAGALGFNYSAADRGAEYCDERVCLCVCVRRVRDHIFGTTRPIFTNFFFHVTHGRGSVLLWRRSDMVRISGFMDGVIFAHKLRLLIRRQAEAVRARLTRSLGLGA